MEFDWKIVCEAREYFRFCWKFEELFAHFLSFSSILLQWRDLIRCIQCVNWLLCVYIHCAHSETIKLHIKPTTLIDWNAWIVDCEVKLNVSTVYICVRIQNCHCANDLRNKYNYQIDAMGFVFFFFPFSFVKMTMTSTTTPWIIIIIVHYSEFEIGLRSIFNPLMFHGRSLAKWLDDVLTLITDMFSICLGQNCFLFRVFTQTKVNIEITFASWTSTGSAWLDRLCELFNLLRICRYVEYAYDCMHE